MRLRGGSPNIFIDIGRAFCVLRVKNLAILAQIDTQKLQISDTLRIFEEHVGAKNYELSNHLGNVLATISDKTIFNTDHYNGIVYSAQLYYPFGWEIPTLSFAAKKYRFGFNGKEDDREWHAQDYGFRLYTPREGRFIDVDPITAQYPELTPYQFASNTPIAAVDLDGLEANVSTIGQHDGGAEPALGKVHYKFHNFQDNRGNMVFKSNDYNPFSLNKYGQEPNPFTITSNEATFEINNKFYIANSFETVKGHQFRSERERLVGSFSGVTKLSQENLLAIIGYSQFVILDLYQNNILGAIKLESNALGRLDSDQNLLDFKSQLGNLFGIPKSELIEIDGIAYNINEAGNYLWGMVIEYNSGLVYPSPNDIAELGSQYQGRSDEPNEQKAITAGRSKGAELFKNVRNNRINSDGEMSKIIFHNRIESNADYYENNKK
jgi:RHS repeat-associated protein